jgi:HK97 family phage portal protein
MKQIIARFARSIARSLENPSTPLSDPDDWLYDALGGTPSDSGVRVTTETALTYSPFWRGVNLISRDVAKLGLHVYKRVGNGKERATDHPAYKLLRYKPNAEMTAFHFKQTLTAHAICETGGYAYIFRRGDATPEEIIQLDPRKTYPVRQNGRLLYVTEVGGELRKLLAQDVLHIKGLSPDGITGYRMIGKAKNSLGLGMAAESYATRYFKNNAEPSVVIEHPGKMTAEAVARLRKQWNEMHQGLDNSHKTAVLEEGMKANPFSKGARESQLIETRQFSIREAANWLNVPPHKLGDTTRTAFASLEQENQSYLDDALDPWLVAWEEECRDKLLTEKEKTDDTHVVEFMRQALLRADMAARGEFYVKATGGHPWMTVNEIRGMENMNPMDGFDDIKPPTNNFGPDKGDPNAKPGDKPKPKPAAPAAAGAQDDTGDDSADRSRVLQAASGCCSTRRNACASGSRRTRTRAPRCSGQNITTSCSPR